MSEKNPGITDEEAEAIVKALISSKPENDPGFLAAEKAAMDCGAVQEVDFETGEVSKGVHRIVPDVDWHLQ